MTYCPHFHIDRGESQCWAVVDNIGKHGMTIEQIQQYTRPTLYLKHKAFYYRNEKTLVKSRIFITERRKH